MESYGVKFIHKLPQFVLISKSRGNCLTELQPKDVKNSDFLTVLLQQTSTKLRETKIKNWTQSSNLEVWLSFKEGLQAKFYTGSFWKECNCFQNTSIIHNGGWTRSHYPWWFFFRKNWSKSFINGISHNRIDDKCICATVFRQHIQLFYKLFTGATESGRSMGSCNLGKILAVNVPKCQRVIFHLLWWKNFGVVWFLRSGTGFYPCITDIGGAMNTLSRKKQSQRELYHIKLSRWRQKIEVYAAKTNRVLHFLVRTWITISDAMSANKLEWCWEERVSKGSACLWHCQHTFSHDIHGRNSMQICWQHKGFIAPLLSLQFWAKTRGHINYRTVHVLWET